MKTGYFRAERPFWEHMRMENQGLKKEHSILRKRIAARREMRENSDAVRQLRLWQLQRELRKAHERMQEPKTLEEYLAQEAKAKLGKAKEFLSGVSLPA